MGEQTLWNRIKEFIGHIAWSIYLWSHNWTEDQYFKIADESYENNGWKKP